MHMGNAANTAYTMATDINTYNINNEMHQSKHNTLNVMTRVVAAMDHGAKREAGPCTYHAHTLNQHWPIKKSSCARKLAFLAMH